MTNTVNLRLDADTRWCLLAMRVLMPFAWLGLVSTGRAARWSAFG